MPANLPTTPQSAPPNFYSQVGQMSSGPGQAPGAPGSPDPSKPASMDADHEFLDTVTQLLTVLAKIGDMKPRGQDITKYTQAAADAMKDCVKQVFNQDMPAPGTQPSAASSAGAPPDMGTGGGVGAPGQ